MQLCLDHGQSRGWNDGSYVRTSALSSRAPAGRASNKDNLKQKQILGGPEKNISFCYLCFFHYYFVLFFHMFIFFLFVYIIVLIFSYVFLVVFMCNYVFFRYFLICSYFSYFCFIFSYFSTFAGPAQIVTYQIVTSSS